ncbi:MAG: peptidylprolyl isomerase [Brasilonema octagenarum HA4186-MV1]|jgi:parvulin-like peptidyl-prolyl isomerase|nr:peptidylprolyl isomerase [Brasilonema octagenarum HA4186-MV1]
MNAPILQIGEKVIYVYEVPFLLHRYQVMPQILRGIIIDQAIADVDCTESECIAAISEFEKQRNITSDKEREYWLRNQGISLEEMHDLAIRPLKIEKFKIATWGKKVESDFLKRKASLDQVVYSVIRHKDRGIVQEIYFRIREREQSFTELAREYSQGSEANAGGIIGPIPLSKLHQNISKLLSVSQPGQLWSPRQVGEWFVILRLEKLLPAQLDEVMRRYLIDELFEKWLAEQIEKMDKCLTLRHKDANETGASQFCQSIRHCVQKSHPILSFS